MMRRSTQYTLLINSMPPHKRELFADGHVPISSIQLHKRLQWLEPQDAKDLSKINALLYWSSMVQGTDADFVAHATTLLATLQHDFIKRMILWRLEMRTIVAALRKRHAGLTTASTTEIRGFGQWPLFIVKNWQRPDFGLGCRLPWVIKAAELVEAENSLSLEKHLLQMVWQQYERESNGHFFDFAAVIIYVLRWDIINRWHQCDPQAALSRFNRTLDNCMQRVEHE